MSILLNALFKIGGGAGVYLTFHCLAPSLQRLVRTGSESGFISPAGFARHGFAFHKSGSDLRYRIASTENLALS